MHVVRVEAALSRARAVWPALAVFAVGAIVLGYLCSRVGDWAVMTDELLYERLALSFAGGGLPRLHGELAETPALLYPLLVSPVFAIVSLPGAIAAVHVLNGVLFASASVPVYVLARALAVSRFAAVAAAVLSIALPWSVIAGFVMSEAAAYPAAMWALLAIYRAVAAPSVREDVVALAAILVATLVRPQLAALGLVLVVAAVAQEARFGRWRAHVVAFAVGALALVGVLVGGAGVLGTYAPALEEGALVSSDALRSAIEHLDVTAVTLGIVPLLLGLGWAFSALARPPDPPRLAFAAVVAAAVVVLALESGSVVVRFGLGIDVKDRYLFYVAPLLFLATACAFEDPRPRLAGVLAMTALFVATVGLADFAPVFGVNLDSPASTTNEALSRLGPPADVLAVVGGVVGAGLFFALRLLPREPVAYVVLVAVVLCVAFEAAYTWNRLLDGSGPSGRAVASAPTDELSWIDAAAGETTVAMLPYAAFDEWFSNATAWWDVEFWNARVTRTFQLGPYFTYTPEIFGQRRLRVNARTGALQGLRGVDYVVRSTRDARLRPAGTAVAASTGLELVALDVPPRAAWFVYGVDPDGWTRTERRAVVRVFPPGGLTKIRVRVVVPEPRTVRVGTASALVQPGADAELAVDVCVPERRFVDVPLAVDGSTKAGAMATPTASTRTRDVGARVVGVDVTASGGGC